MKDFSTLTILITGACGVTSRSVVRSLKLSAHFGNARFIGTDVCENLYGLVEGLYHRIYRVPRYNDESYTEAVSAVCNREGVDLAIVIPELEVLHWARNRIPVACLLPPKAFCETAGSKVALYRALEASGAIPGFKIVPRGELSSQGFTPPAGWPCWIRDYGVGSTSGLGSLLAENAGQAIAWATLNPKIENFMVSEFLPGRNFACHLLYHEGKLVKSGMYERMEYFMGRIAPSGISGNISKGRLLEDHRVLETSIRAVETICAQTRETMQGLVAVDLRENLHGDPMITEINLRHVACTSAFAVAGNNLAEAQVFATLGMIDRIDGSAPQYPRDNLILRDIDGPALWVPNLSLPPIGASMVPTP